MNAEWPVAIAPVPLSLRWPHDVAAEILAAHNAGLNKSTARARPWSLVTLIRFSHEGTARKFEAYLKSGSGRAFARTRLE